MYKLLDKKIIKDVKALTDDCYKDNMLLLDKVCKKLNLKCFDADFDDDKISGLLIKNDKDDSYSIYVNRHHPANRKRFTIAHEIGHYVSFLNGSFSEEELRTKNQVTDYSIMWRRKDVQSDAENEANLIAAEILMPRDKVEDLITQEKTPEEMASMFYVSVSAMTLRLINLYPEHMVF